MNGGRLHPSGGRDPHHAGPVVLLDGRFQLDMTPAGPDPTPTVGVIDTGIIADGGAAPAWSAGRVLFEPADIEQAPARGADGLAGHGTFVCGLVLSQAPDAVIRMRGVIDETTPGAYEDRAVADALTELAAHVKLINLSFSGHPGEALPTALIAAVNALDEEVVLVAAAGNGGSSQPVFPAAIRPRRALMVSVGAVDESASGSGRPLVADFSNHWRGLSLFASGVLVRGPHSALRSAARSGTSFAAALVTGNIADTAHRQGVSVREAADGLLAGLVSERSTVPVHTVNGPHDTPYLATGAAVVSREDLNW